ncbi:PaaX family transcriptional regulator C-terminal domain-containing protein [Streptomyces aquilus]|uniref:PaaX family transcriptional regulator n=1 Tax=Streptomyces aquilus TaxID=2548456 RepID=UPI0036CE09F0
MPPRTRKPPTDAPSSRRTAGRSARGGLSATQALLTVLAEYVAPQSSGVWQETLVQALGALGHSPAAVRQAISRSTKEGALTTARHGNRAYVELSEDALATLRQGERAMSEEPGPESWNGEWDVFVVRSRGKDQASAYQLRTSMLLRGLGYLGNGVWLSPHARLKEEIVRALSSEPGVDVVVLRSHIEHPEASAVVERAWDLDAIVGSYKQLLTRFGNHDPQNDEQRFLAWTELAHAWRDCVMTDPQLPADVLRAHWPRERASALVAERRGQWRPAAQAYFGALVGDDSRT